MRKLNVMLTPLMIEERSNVEVRACVLRRLTLIGHHAGYSPLRLAACGGGTMRDML